MSRNEFVWTEKYRPQTIDDCILPERTKKTFKDFLKQGEVPNLLLSGPPGCGKTTVAKALCNELGVDVYVPSAEKLAVVQLELSKFNHAVVSVLVDVGT